MRRLSGALAGGPVRSTRRVRVLGSTRVAIARREILGRDPALGRMGEGTRTEKQHGGGAGEWLSAAARGERLLLTLTAPVRRVNQAVHEMQIMSDS